MSSDLGPDEVRALDLEWERIELLAQLAVRLRQGTPPDDVALARLRELQHAVREDRDAGVAWSRLGGGFLDALAHDILACAIAPEVEPRIGWLFQQLHPGAAQPYPSPALVQELLALSPHQAVAIAAALADDAPLRRARLVEFDGSGPYAPIQPARGVAARLMGAPPPRTAPPGATRVSVDACWDDLVLPANRVALLREFLHWVRHRHTVVEAWGGRAVGGPLALFAGPPGTGKTLAAAVLASELGWPLYRVDLGALVSKYIGETEKNLNRLFTAAHGQPMVLQFDEADSLFGRRGDVRDARDRYANLEVSHLLSRVEQHEGPCILTTNLRAHLDPAFTRRFQVVVDFPRPEADARAHLWRLHLPPRAPRAADLDVAFLGRVVGLSGGGIRNAALHAAFLAAAGRGTIGMREVALAVWRELSKDGHAVARADLGPLGAYLEEASPC